MIYARSVDHPTAEMPSTARFWWFQPLLATAILAASIWAAAAIVTDHEAVSAWISSLSPMTSVTGVLYAATAIFALLPLLPRWIRTLAFFALVVMFCAAPAFAQTSSDPFAAATSRLNQARGPASLLIASVGFIGMLGLIVMAYFGRFQWKWAFSLGGGLVLLGLATVIINYFVGTIS